jgi:hypothetical protein
MDLSYRIEPLNETVEKPPKDIRMKKMRDFAME